MSLVSVIMPVHDTAPYLEASLSSVLRQSMEDIEIILAENLSTDGSYEMCDALAEKDSRIRVLHLDRAGLSNARNEGIRHASSDYLVFIDSDDVIEQQMLEKLYSAATQYRADIAVCNYDWVFPDGTSKKPYREGKDPVFMDTVAFTYAILTEQVCSSACVGLYRKDMFGDGRIWFPVDRFYEDRATTYRLAAAAVNGGVLVPESMYHYIQREGSICHTMDFKKFFHHCLADTERLEFISSSGMFRGMDKRSVRKLYEAVAGTWFWSFSQMITLSDSDEKYLEICRLRDRMLSAVSVSSFSRLSLKRKLMEMKMAWPLYYCFRAGKKTRYPSR